MTVQDNSYDLIEIRSRYFWDKSVYFNIRSKVTDIQTKDLWVLSFLNDIPFKTEPISLRKDILRWAVSHLFLRITLGAEVEKIHKAPNVTEAYAKKYKSDFEQWKKLNLFGQYDHLINEIRKGEQAKVSLGHITTEQKKLFKKLRQAHITSAIVDLLGFWMTWTGEKIPKSHEYSKGIENCEQPNLDGLPESYKFVIRCFYSCGLKLKSSNVISDVANKNDKRNILVGFDELIDLANEPFEIPQS